MPTWAWVLIGAIAAFGLVHLYRWLGRPIAYRHLGLEDLTRYLDGFLLQSGPGAVFDLTREGGAGFLQLVVAQRGSARAEVEFGLPEISWSADRFDAAHDALRAAGYPCRVEAGPPAGEVTRFLRIRLADDRSALTPATISLLQTAASALGFQPGELYTLRMQGAFSPEYTLELADQLDQTPRGGRLAQRMAKHLRRGVQKEDGRAL
ncbi:hypothetical protein BH20GEM2_BH20GEM2_15950 [soil metagenome]